MDLNKKDIHIYFDMDGTVNHWDLMVILTKNIISDIENHLKMF